MPHVPQRPPALDHLSDEAASVVLAKHFGDVVKAAKELNVDRKDLRRLTWHNPRILKASHERMGLFRIGVRSKIIEAVWSRSAKRRRWGVDAMFDSYEFSISCSTPSYLRRRRGKLQRLLRQTAPSLFSSEKQRLSLLASRLLSSMAIVGESRRAPRSLTSNLPEISGKASQAQAGSLWPAGIQRPSRGRRWR
jgi:hypothetical protein